VVAVSLARQTTPQIRTITYNDEAAPWSRSNHLLRTRLLLSSDDSNNNSRTLGRIRIEIIINQAILCLGLFNYAYFFPPAPNYSLYKPKAHICIPKDRLKCLLCLGSWRASDFSTLCHYLVYLVYLVYLGEWLDLICCACGLGFQSQFIQFSN
jgi:hypothetical protein